MFKKKTSEQALEKEHILLSLIAPDVCCLEERIWDELYVESIGI